MTDGEKSPPAEDGFGRTILKLSTSFGTSVDEVKKLVSSTPEFDALIRKELGRSTDNFFSQIEYFSKAIDPSKPPADRVSDFFGRYISFPVEADYGSGKTVSIPSPKGPVKDTEGGERGYDPLHYIEYHYEKVMKETDHGKTLTPDVPFDESLFPREACLFRKFYAMYCLPPPDGEEGKWRESYRDSLVTVMKKVNASTDPEKTVDGFIDKWKLCEGL